MMHSTCSITCILTLCPILLWVPSRHPIIHLHKLMGMKGYFWVVSLWTQHIISMTSRDHEYVITQQLKFSHRLLPQNFSSNQKKKKVTLFINHIVLNEFAPFMFGKTFSFKIRTNKEYLLTPHYSNWHHML